MRSGFMALLAIALLFPGSAAAQLSLLAKLKPKDKIALRTGSQWCKAKVLAVSGDSIKIEAIKPAGACLQLPAEIRKSAVQRMERTAFSWSRFAAGFGIFFGALVGGIAVAFGTENAGLGLAIIAGGFAGSLLAFSLRQAKYVLYL